MSKEDKKLNVNQLFWEQVGFDLYRRRHTDRVRSAFDLQGHGRGI